MAPRVHLLCKSGSQIFIITSIGNMAPVFFFFFAYALMETHSVISNLADFL